MDPKKLLGNVPWITKEGYFDPGSVPHRRCSETGTLR